MRTKIWLLSGLLLAATSVPARAQGHEGFWIGFGLGGGRTGGSSAQNGGGAYVRMGGTPVPQLLVGGEAIAWARSENNTTVSEGNVTADVLFYPSLTSGFFLKTGLGFANVRAQASTGNVSVTVTDNGFGTTFGAGYDLKLGNNLYLTPNFDALVQVIKSGGTTNTGTVFLLTVGLTWH